MSNTEENEIIPDRDTCQKLTEQFAEITGTDVACAQFYLQDRNWDLEKPFHIVSSSEVVCVNVFQRSVNAFFEVSQTGGVSVLHDGDAPGIVVNVE
ncbi:hypothetical protein PR048_024948 [Dryococelus australis]|uniref:UBA-like domain-containing protein n=1 Tax=Dryococelus australis TaxID=614101 RepID=A0ABQ9GPZ4_9NEOP|nr:hypothetical protein PR048_024948 [Dryococelus australis]